MILDFGGCLPHKWGPRILGPCLKASVSSLVKVEGRTKGFPLVRCESLILMRMYSDDDQTVSPYNNFDNEGSFTPNRVSKLHCG